MKSIQLTCQEVLCIKKKEVKNGRDDGGCILTPLQGSGKKCLLAAGLIWIRLGFQI